MMGEEELRRLYLVLRSVNDHLVRATNFASDVELGITHQQLNDEVLSVLEELFDTDDPIVE